MMASDFAKTVREAFQYTHPGNPLRKLTEEERMFIVASLVMYKTKLPRTIADPWEQTAKTATEAATLAKRISQVLKAKHLEPLKDFEPLKSYFGAFEELPRRLRAFAVVVGGLLRHLSGKPGHQQKVLHNQSLVMASQFVRCRTGKYYDGHLAELCQAIGNDSELKDFSADAIRRKREHFKKTYPLLYAYVATKASKLASRAEKVSSGDDPSQATPLGLTKAMGLSHLTFGQSVPRTLPPIKSGAKSRRSTAKRQ
jgi:hypothetical protein